MSPFRHRIGGEFDTRRASLTAALALPIALAILVLSPGDLRPQEVVATAVPTAADLAERAAELDEAIPALREATARFRDVEVALAEGYVRDPMNLCITAPVEGHPPQLGGMGIHFFRPDLLGLTETEPRVNGTGVHTDFSNPSVLVYFPDEEGELRLGAIENLVFRDAWLRAGNSEPPEFHGHEYWALADNPATPDVDEAHMFEPHYELHLWIHEENPNGVAFPFNPNVSCKGHDGPTTLAEGVEWAKSHAPPPGGS
ncbi:MAG: hypothetical protein ACODAA_01395 [Gemmatimonadota bacterium]